MIRDPQTIRDLQTIHDQKDHDPQQPYFGQHLAFGGDTFNEKKLFFGYILNLPCNSLSY